MMHRDVMKIGCSQWKERLYNDSYDGIQQPVRDRTLLDLILCLCGCLLNRVNFVVSVVAS